WAPKPIEARTGRYVRNYHARLFREAPHNHRLERAYQRSAPGWKRRHRTRLSDRAAVTTRDHGYGPAHSDRISGPSRAAVHRRAGKLGRNWRADDRIS